MTRPAARVDDLHICLLTTPTLHVGGPVLAPGAPNTKFNGRPAARVGDKASCIAPAPDTIRGGLMTVFIDGSPASRIFDKTDVYFIFTGSSDVLLGEWSGGPLTPFQAQWLYDYLSKQGEIPYEYATDGCWVRADRMAQYMESLGVGVEKVWVEAHQDSELKVSIPGYVDDTPPQYGGPQKDSVTWGWHVAPVISVDDAARGVCEIQVIDPSLGFGGPVSVADWVGKQTTDPSTVDTFFTDAKVYKAKQITRLPTDTMRNPDTTKKELNIYRDHRENLDPSTGRYVPNGPVHY